MPFGIYKDIRSIFWQFSVFYGHLVYFTVIWCILLSFGVFYGHMVYFTVIWFIFPQFCIFYQENLANHFHGHF
jgi:hypothetical protein